MIEANPEAILIGDNPHLIDECQIAPDLWNCVRSEIDHRDNKFGQFIFTGNSTPAEKDNIYRFGSRRIVTIKMRPMSLYESNDSKGLVSLKELINEKKNYCSTLFEFENSKNQKLPSFKMIVMASGDARIKDGFILFQLTC